MSLCSRCHKLVCLPYLIFKFAALDWQYRTYVFIRAILSGIFEEKLMSNWNTMNHWAYSIIRVRGGALRIFSESPWSSHRAMPGRAGANFCFPSLENFPTAKDLLKLFVLNGAAQSFFLRIHHLSVWKRLELYNRWPGTFSYIVWKTNPDMFSVVCLTIMWTPKNIQSAHITR